MPAAGTLEGGPGVRVALFIVQLMRVESTINPQQVAAPQHDSSYWEREPRRLTQLVRALADFWFLRSRRSIPASGGRDREHHPEACAGIDHRLARECQLKSMPAGLERDHFSEWSPPPLLGRGRRGVRCGGGRGYGAGRDLSARDWLGGREPGRRSRARRPSFNPGHRYGRGVGSRRRHDSLRGNRRGGAGNGSGRSGGRRGRALAARGEDRHRERDGVNGTICRQRFEIIKRG